MDLANHQPSGAPALQSERRHAPRHAVQVQVELHEVGTEVPLRLVTTDLSRGGCYVQLMMPLPPGIYVNATLWIDGCPIRIRGRVVTRHPQFGNGIMFLEFQDNGEQLLSRYLDTIVDR